MQESGVHYLIIQFEVDFKPHYDLITMMVFTFLHFVFFLLMRHRTCVLAIDFG